jgi:putative membrane protein (TIGR04086 family)
MRKTILNFSITTLFLIISTFIISFILSLLHYYNVINHNFYNILTNIFSILIFLGSGIFLGIKSENKGWLKGLILGLFYLLITLLVHFSIIKDTLEFQSVLNMLIKFIILPIGSIIGVNLK